MIATKGFLTALQYTKFVFGRGSAPPPLREFTAQRSPAPQLNFGEEVGREKGNGRKEKGKEGDKGGGREGEKKEEKG